MWHYWDVPWLFSICKFRLKLRTIVNLATNISCTFYFHFFVAWQKNNSDCKTVFSDRHKSQNYSGIILGISGATARALTPRVVVRAWCILFPLGAAERCFIYEAGQERSHATTSISCNSRCTTSATFFNVCYTSLNTCGRGTIWRTENVSSIMQPRNVNFLF